VRCPRCGNENPATNRFCGMCGTSLLQTPTPVQATAAQPPAAATAAGAAKIAPPPAAPAASGAVTNAASSPLSIEEIRRLAGVSEPAPSPAHAGEAPRASVPSFLGLNEPASSSRRRTNPLSIDPHAAPSSGNLDYLLEDEEEHKGGGGWKFIVIVIALALAAGFGYLRWRNQSVARTGADGNKPAAAAQTSEAPDASPSPAPTSAAPGPASSSNGSTSQPAPSSAATDNVASPASTSPSSTPASSGAANPTSNPATGAQPNPASDASAGNAPAAQPAANTAVAPSGATGAAAPKPAPAKAKPSPSLAADDPVARAQRYIYGKGVTQDCDRGMRILKPAVDQGNPKAMVEMGALYSAGLCTPHDLPTAYRWFALALRKDPNNVSLQADLNKLWGEMTQPERQLAIRLSQ